MRADSLVLRGLLAALVAWPLALQAAPAADPFTGEWEFQGARPDPTTGNEEYLRIRLKLQDDGVVCGIFLSGWQGGRRIVEGFLRGKARGNRIDEVTYDAGWADVAGHGAGRIRLRNGKLEWQVTRPYSTDYMIRKAVLERADAMLEEPPPCR
jgi:hypothetical protein